MPKILDKSYQQQLISHYADALVSKCTPAAVIVFGSAARGGEMTENSDIDLAVILPDSKSLVTAKAAWYSSPPKGIDLWPCDILWYTEVEFLNRVQKGGVAEIISTEGIIAHGRLP